MCNRFVSDFNDQQFNNLKSFLEGEEWNRLPLPDNYQIADYTHLLEEYPHDFKHRVSIFENYFNGRLENYEKTDSFSDFANGSPFDKISLISFVEEDGTLEHSSTSEKGPINFGNQVIQTNAYQSILKKVMQPKRTKRKIEEVKSTPGPKNLNMVKSFNAFNQNP